MGVPVPASGSVTEDEGVVGGLLSTNGDIDYLIGDDTGDWTAVSNDTSLGFGSSFSIDEDGSWLFSVDNSDPGIQALDSGESLEFQYTVSSTNGDSTVTITVLGADEPPCFVKGTLIDTPLGQRPIETLQVGDFVTTADAGPVAIRWIGSRLCSVRDGKNSKSVAPIEIRQNALGPGVPSSTLRVSPLHRVLMKGPQVQMHFGEQEVLCAAKALVNGSSIQQSPIEEDIEYFHILLDKHHIIIANGCESETLFPGPRGLGSFGKAEREQIFSVFPELQGSLETYGSCARLVLKNYEAQLLAKPMFVNAA